MLRQTFGDAPNRKPRKRVNSAEKYSVIKSIAEVLNVKSYPPMDERLKSIVAVQVGSLLKGGWPVDEIRSAAIELALAWDVKRGHNRLAHLAVRVRTVDAARREAQHRERERIERAELAAGAPVGSTMRHPNLHDFVASDDPSSCRICTGPIGVHVKKLVEVEA